MARPTPRQFRMARAFLEWSVEKVVEETELSYQTVLNAEHEGHALRESTAQILKQRYEDAGLRFISDDGVQRRTDDILEIVGNDCYLTLLEDVLVSLKKTGGEVLFMYADERRSPPEVVEKFRELRSAGIKMRSIIPANLGFYMGLRTEYRGVEEQFFSPYDVIVIYSDRTAYFLSKEVPLRVLSIRSEIVTEHNRRQFEFMWAHTKMPPEDRENDERF